MLPITDTLNQYHDDMRQINFDKVTKMLNDNDDGKTKKSYKAHVPLKNRILDSLLKDLTPRPHSPVYPQNDEIISHNLSKHNGVYLNSSYSRGKSLEKLV